MLAQGIGHLLVIAFVMGGLLVPGNTMAVMVGKPAPDFTLPSTAGEDITLRQFRGEKMVLIEFYAINFGTT